MQNVRNDIILVSKQESTTLPQRRNALITKKITHRVVVRPATISSPVDDDAPALEFVVVGVKGGPKGRAEVKAKADSCWTKSMSRVVSRIQRNLQGYGARRRWRTIRITAKEPWPRKMSRDERRDGHGR